MASARNNPRLSDNARSALAYWPQISRAAALGLSTADLWSDIRDAAETIGLASPGVTVQGVSQLRGIAGQIERTSAALNKAKDGKRLINGMVSTPPWARDVGSAAPGRQFQVRFLHTTTVDGEQVTEWRTTKFSGRLPRTVGDLRYLVEGDAIQLARKYKGEHVGTDSLQLLEL